MCVRGEMGMTRVVRVGEKVGYRGGVNGSVFSGEQ